MGALLLCHAGQQLKRLFATERPARQAEHTRHVAFVVRQCRIYHNEFVARTIALLWKSNLLHAFIDVRLFRHVDLGFLVLPALYWMIVDRFCVVVTAVHLFHRHLNKTENLKCSCGKDLGACGMQYLVGLFGSLGWIDVVDVHCPFDPAYTDKTFVRTTFQVLRGA